MKTDIVLTDKNGNIIEVKVPRPEYFHGKNGDDYSSSPVKIVELLFVFKCILKVSVMCSVCGTTI